MLVHKISVVKGCIVWGVILGKSYLLTYLNDRPLPFVQSYVQPFMEFYNVTFDVITMLSLKPWCAQSSDSDTKISRPQFKFI